MTPQTLEGLAAEIGIGVLTIQLLVGLGIYLVLSEIRKLSKKSRPSSERNVPNL